MKVSRYQWPTDKHERIALIVANLTVAIPDRRWGTRVKPTKDEAEVEIEETDNEA